MGIPFARANDAPTASTFEAFDLNCAPSELSWIVLSAALALLPAHRAQAECCCRDLESSARSERE